MKSVSSMWSHCGTHEDSLNPHTHHLWYLECTHTDQTDRFHLQQRISRMFWEVVTQRRFCKLAQFLCVRLGDHRGKTRETWWMVCLWSLWWVGGLQPQEHVMTAEEFQWPPNCWEARAWSPSSSFSVKHFSPLTHTNSQLPLKVWNCLTITC